MKSNLAPINIALWDYGINKDYLWNSTVDLTLLAIKLKICNK